MRRETCLIHRLCGCADAPVLTHVAPDLAQLQVPMGPIDPLHMKPMALQSPEIMQQLYLETWGTQQPVGGEQIEDQQQHDTQSGGEASLTFA